MKCPECGTFSSDGVFCCYACGVILNNADGIHCHVHPEVTAEGCCTVCWKTACAGCLVRRDGKIFCSKEHEDFSAANILLGTSALIEETDVIVANLRESGFEPTMFFPEDHLYKGTISDRLMPKVFIKKNQLQDAIGKIQEMDLTDFITIEPHDVKI
jgi:hypothetical protein